jgi:hypothetical protein
MLLVGIGLVMRGRRPLAILRSSSTTSTIHM